LLFSHLGFGFAFFLANLLIMAIWWGAASDGDLVSKFSGLALRRVSTP